MKPKAFIFDLDGVLTDTAKYHYLAWKQLADSLGYKFDETVNERLKGVSRTRSFEIILEVNNVREQYSDEKISRIADEKNAEYVKLIEQITPKDILPEVERFLNDARLLGIKLAVASASRNAERVLELLELTNFFDYVANAALISKTKPDPEVFLNCCEGLGISPAEAIGFEDAQAGIEAIKAAGMYAVGIGVEVTGIAPDLPLESTKELNVEAILQQFQIYNL